MGLIFGKKEDEVTEYTNGLVDSKKKIDARDSRRMVIVLVKVIVYTIVYLVLGVVGAEILKLFVLPYIAQYGKLSVTNLLLNNVNGFRDSTYAKYCYVVLAFWIYLVLSEIILIIKTIKKIDCIKNDECLSCENYLKCKFKDIKVERSY